MSGDNSTGFDAAFRATLDGGLPVIYVAPPASWCVTSIFRDLPASPAPGLERLILVPDAESALDLCQALAAQPDPSRGIVHPCTGLERTEKLLRQDAIHTLVSTAADAHYLLKRSALKSEKLIELVVLWPESMSPADLDTLLGDAPAAQRLIATEDEKSCEDLLVRHAHRAPVGVISRAPGRPLGTVRYAIVPQDRRVSAARTTIDIMAPARTTVWDPVAPGRWLDLTKAPDVHLFEPDQERSDLVIAADLPSAEVLSGLLKAATDVVVFVRPTQVPYLQGMANLSALRMPGELDRIRGEAARLRESLRRRLSEGSLAVGLQAIEPLLEEHDPALVAAAALSLQSEPSPTISQEPVTSPPVATWTKVFVTAGRRDQVTHGDVLSALVRSTGIQKDDVGEIDVKENFTLVEIRPEQAHRAIRGMDGEQVRGRRVTARLDRHTVTRGHGASGRSDNS